LYSKEIDEKWVNTSTYLLLNLIAKNPDFNDKSSIFSDPLSKCQYRDYKIDTSYNALSHTMAPLFSQTLSNDDNNNKLTVNNDEDVIIEDDERLINSTIAPMFSLTQDNKSLLLDPSLLQSSLLFKPFKKITSKYFLNN
jgi:hypothetical protein